MLQLELTLPSKSSFAESNKTTARLACLASKPISDTIASPIRSKAGEVGREFVKVNAAYTSQDCSRCGHRQKMPLSNRMYICPCCHLEINRDLNAALNIFALGLQSIGNQSIEAASR